MTIWEIAVLPANRMAVRVDDTGIEPVTPTMSMWCSTAEPIVLGI